MLSDKRHTKQTEKKTKKIRTNRKQQGHTHTDMTTVITFNKHKIEK